MKNQASISFRKLRIRPFRMLIVVVLMSSCIFSITRSLVNFQSQTGFINIGIPSPLKEFNATQAGFSILYPSAWSPGETPHGDHGDLEVIAGIFPPGRSYPRLIVSWKSFLPLNTQDVVKWGIERAKKQEKFMPNASIDFPALDVKGLIYKYSYSKAQIIIGSSSIHCIDLFTWKEDLGYALDFCADSRDWSRVQPVFIEMIKSFTLR
jgi:hypothetical protein